MQGDFFQQQERNGILSGKISPDEGRTVTSHLSASNGGARRIAIMDTLDSPKLRNKIANLMGTDWKEVDRNLGILELVNLVKI